jgi:hypothetical protein
MRTETGGALVLLGATLAALAWANSPWWHTYEAVWRAPLSIRVGRLVISQDLRHRLNNGLMTFFLVVGLEAKRELDIGELRERRRRAVSMVAALGGTVVPVAIYLAVNAGGQGGHGWGAAMSTDIAFALGVLALVAPASTRLRVRLLTLTLSDDLVALLVIIVAYTGRLSLVPLLIAIGPFTALLALRYAPYAWRLEAVAALGAILWLALYGFTVSLLISSLAFRGQALQEAKVGVLASALAATALSWLAFRLIARLRKATRARQMAGTLEEIVDLSEDVDPERDHIRGGHGAPVTLVEYRDYECPYCGQAEPVVRELLLSFGDDLRYVWRHLPLADVHPHAQIAAEAAEGAGSQAHSGKCTTSSSPTRTSSLHQTSSATPRNSGSTTGASGSSCGKRHTPIASPRMSPAPMPAESPAPQASLPTASGKTADTTSPRSRPGCGQHAAAPPPPDTRDARLFLGSTKRHASTVRCSRSTARAHRRLAGAQARLNRQ